MSFVSIALFVLAVLNLIAIALAIFFRKGNLALGLAFVEVLLVSLASII